MSADKFLIPKVYVSYEINRVLADDYDFGKVLSQCCNLFFSSEYGNISEQENIDNESCMENAGSRIGRYMSEYGEIVITEYLNCIKIALSDESISVE